MLALALLLQATAPAPAAPDGRAQDVVDLFMGHCALPMLGSAASARQLNADPAHARAMTADELARAAPASPGSAGWIVHGDRDGWAAIVFQPATRTCMVSVRAADRQALEQALTGAVSQFYTGTLKLKKVDAKPVEHAVADGIARDTLAWEIQFPNQHRSRIAIFATAADAPVNGRQALLTSVVER